MNAVLPIQDPAISAMAFICEGKTMEALANINYYIMQALIEQYPVTEYSEEDLNA